MTPTPKHRARTSSLQTAAHATSQARRVRHSSRHHRGSVAILGVRIQFSMSCPALPQTPLAFRPSYRLPRVRWFGGAEWCGNRLLLEGKPCQPPNLQNHTFGQRRQSRKYDHQNRTILLTSSQLRRTGVHPPSSFTINEHEE
jgi:hypothetical protein